MWVLQIHPICCEKVRSNRDPCCFPGCCCGIHACGFGKWWELRIWCKTLTFANSHCLHWSCCEFSPVHPSAPAWAGILCTASASSDHPGSCCLHPREDSGHPKSLWQSRDPQLAGFLHYHLLPASGEWFSSIPWDRRPWLRHHSPAGFSKGYRSLQPVPFLLQAPLNPCNKTKAIHPPLLLGKRGQESESFHANVTQLPLNCQNKWQKWGKWHQIKNVTGDRFMSSTVAAAEAGERDTVITQH